MSRTRAPKRPPTAAADTPPKRDRTEATRPSPATDAKPLGFLARVEAALAARKRLVLACVLLIAAAVRVLYFADLSSSPIGVIHKWDQSDMSYYDAWAHAILDGDVLTQRFPPPLHYWARQISDAWLTQHPELLPDIAREAAAKHITGEQALSEFAERAVWAQWVGPKRFYQEPGYPYLVALTYRIFGPEPRWVIVWQMLLGIANVTLAFRLTIHRFGTLAATLASLGAALAVPTLAFEGTLLRDPLITTLSLVLVWLTERAVERHRTRDWALLGLCTGLSLMAKGTFLLYAMGIVAYLAISALRRPKGTTTDGDGDAAATRPIALALRRAAVFAVAAFIGLTPVIARNVIVGAPPLAIAGKNAVASFAQNNLPTYIWSESTVAYKPDQFGRIMGESDGSLFRAVQLCIKEHPTGVRALFGIALSKFDAVWHWWERPDNVNIYYFQSYSRVLRNPVTFWTVTIPGLVGLVLSLRHASRHWPLYLMIGTPLVQMVIFSVMGRYRLPILLGLLPFAGLAIVQTARWLAERRVQGVVAIIAMAAIGAWTGRPMPANPSLIRCADAVVAFITYYQKPLLAEMGNQDYPAAADIMREYFRHEPPVLATLDANHPPRTFEEYELARVFSAYKLETANILSKIPGAEDEALRYTRQARNLDAAIKTCGAVPQRKL